MRRRQHREVPATEPIRACPKWATSMVWHGPIHEHLDRLVAAAVDDGESDGLSRAELAAALVYTAPTDGSELRRRLEKYRRGKAGDLLPAPENVVVLRSHGPGRR